MGVRYTLVEIAERDRWKCHLCGKTVRKGLPGTHRDGPTIDHLLPIADGGDDTPENVALAHRICNVSRGRRGEIQLRLVG